MVLPTTGPLTFTQIREEFGGSAPDTLSEYYRGGTNVPDLTAGRSEVQTVSAAGVTNTAVEAMNEIVTIEFDDNFDGGVTGNVSQPTDGSFWFNFVGVVVDADDGESIAGDTYWSNTLISWAGTLVTSGGVSAGDTEFVASDGFTYFRGDPAVGSNFYALRREGPSTSASYVFEIDTSQVVYPGFISGSFTDNSNATSALNQLSTAVLGEFAGVTTSAVSNAPVIGMDVTYDLSGLTYPASTGSGLSYLRVGSTDLEGASILYLSLPVNTTFNSATELVAALSDSLSTGVNSQITPAGTYVVTTLTDSVRVTSTDSVLETGSKFVVLDSALVTGLTVTDNHTDTTYTNTSNAISGKPSGKMIMFDTNQTTNLSQSLVITQNNGFATDPIISAQHGTPGEGTLSSVSFRDDSAGVFAAFTSANETFTEILNRLETMIDPPNIESPVDFEASVEGSALILTAQSPGAVDLWSFTATHGDGDGSLAFSDVERVTRGVPVGTNANIPTSGPINITAFYGGDNGETQ